MIETWTPLGNGNSHWSYHLSVVIGHKSLSTVMVNSQYNNSIASYS